MTHMRSIKYARFLNGVDLDKLRVGQSIDLPSQIARMLLAEGWAVLVDSDEGFSVRQLTSFGSGQADLIRFWKRADGTSCIVARRETVLYIRVEQNGSILKEQPVESPRHAMLLAKLWDEESRE